MLRLVSKEPTMGHRRKAHHWHSHECLVDCINGGHCEPAIRHAYRDQATGFNMRATKRCKKCDRVFTMSDEEKEIYN